MASKLVTSCKSTISQRLAIAKKSKIYLTRMKTWETDCVFCQVLSVSSLGSQSHIFRPDLSSFKENGISMEGMSRQLHLATFMDNCSLFIVSVHSRNLCLSDYSIFTWYNQVWTSFGNKKVFEKPILIHVDDSTFIAAIWNKVRPWLNRQLKRLQGWKIPC